MPIWEDCPAGLTIERLDNNRGYCKANCEWRSKKAQARNRRSNHIVEHDGREMALSEACELAGVSYGTIQKRISTWRCSFEEAIGDPVIVHPHWSAATFHRHLEAFFDEMAAAC